MSNVQSANILVFTNKSQKVITDHLQAMLLGESDQSRASDTKAKEHLLAQIAQGVARYNKRKTAKYDYRAGKGDPYAEFVRGIRDVKGATTEAKLASLNQELVSHPNAPAFTPHPTNPYSVEFENAYYALEELCMLSSRIWVGSKTEGKRRNIAEKLQRLAKKLGQNVAIDVHADALKLQTHAEALTKVAMERFRTAPLTPTQSLSVGAEVDRVLEVYEEMFHQYASTKKHIVDEFIRAHGTPEGGLAAVETALAEGIRAQYQNIAFWTASDADGNKNVTPNTMRLGLFKQQAKLFALYEEAAQVQKVDDRQLKLITDAKAAAKAAAATMDEHGKPVGDVKAAETTLAAARQALAKAQSNMPAGVQDLMQTFGFMGPRMDIRQSTGTLDVVTEAVLELLKKSKEYGVQYKSHDWEALKGDADKLNAFITNVMVNDEILTFIDKNKSQMPAAARTELDRIMLTQQYPDIFKRYRISDARTVADAKLVRLMEKLGQRALGKPETKVLDVITLCETQQDIERLPQTVANMLVSGVVGNNRLILFPGYSDAEKRMGLAGLTVIDEAVAKAVAIVDVYNANLPEGAKPIDLIISHGQGDDIMRHGGKPCKDSTVQGLAAMRWKSRANRKDFMGNTMGTEDNHRIRLGELEINQAEMLQYLNDARKMTGQKALAASKPSSSTASINGELKALYAKVTEHSIASYRNMVEHDTSKGMGNATAAMLLHATVAEAVKATNTSSRAASKGLAVDAFNHDSERAIGYSAYWSASGTQGHLLGGQFFLSELDNKERANLPELFKQSTVFQDITYKRLYGAAISDYQRGWEVLAAKGEQNFGVAGTREYGVVSVDYPAKGKLSLETLETVLQKASVVIEELGKNKEAKTTLERNIAPYALAYTQLKGFESLKSTVACLPISDEQRKLLTDQIAAKETAFLKWMKEPQHTPSAVPSLAECAQAVITQAQFVMGVQTFRPQLLADLQEAVVHTTSMQEDIRLASTKAVGELKGASTQDKAAVRNAVKDLPSLYKLEQDIEGATNSFNDRAQSQKAAAPAVQAENVTLADVSKQFAGASKSHSGVSF